jgi:hypothetical protein
MEDARIGILVFEFGEKKILTWVCSDEHVYTGHFLFNMNAVNIFSAT